MSESKSRLLKKYNSQIVDRLVAEFAIKNRMAVPRVLKVVINAGIGETLKNKELLQSVIRDFSAIAGQKPAPVKARISVATFGIRKGMVVGLKTTLRGIRMYDFLDKLFSITLPRLRDFRGLSAKSFDKDGNYTLGIEEQIVFPEVDVTKAAKTFGFEISIVTNCKDVEKSRRLLELLGLPFEK
jgi:large subunit ribosomal protein L5